MTRLEHVGIAVSDPAAAAKLYELILDLGLYKVEQVESENVSTLFFDGGGSKLELIESAHPSSAIARFIDRHGPGLHHLAFEVPSVEAAMRTCREAGLRVLNDEPTVGADGKIVAFVHPKDFHGVLIELCESARPVWKEDAVEFDGRSIKRYSAGRLLREDRALLVALSAGDFETDIGHTVSLFEKRYDVCGFDISDLSTDVASSLVRSTVRDFAGQRPDGAVLVCAPGVASILSGASNRSTGIRASAVHAATSGHKPDPRSELPVSDQTAARSLPRPLVVSADSLAHHSDRKHTSDEMSYAVVPDYGATTDRDRQEWFARLAIRHFDGVR